jgi:ubiquinone/menaquinone biosynthesis C-methylase UbiE
LTGGESLLIEQHENASHILIFNNLYILAVEMRISKHAYNRRLQKPSFMSSDMLSYYRERAKEYEKVYLKPERQKELLRLTHVLQNIFNEKKVLEIACGTGYWTERIAKTAITIKAIDINDTVLKIAKAKQYPRANVTFEQADIFQPLDEAKYNNLFGGFIWSHIKLQDIPYFIDIVSSQVEKGGTIVFIDNNFVEGSSLSIAERDSLGNTYQIRQLEDGSTYKILKNFPSQLLLEKQLKNKAENLTFVNMEYYWMLKYVNL